MGGIATPCIPRKLLTGQSKVVKVGSVLSTLVGVTESGQDSLGCFVLPRYQAYYTLMSLSVQWHNNCVLCTGGTQSSSECLCYPADPDSCSQERV